MHSQVYLGNTNFSDSVGFSVPVLELITFTGFFLGSCFIVRETETETEIKSLVIFLKMN